MNRYPERVTVYTKDFDVNNYGFGFQKNAEGEKLVKEFKEFLGKTDIDSLYYKWTHSKTKDLHIDTNLPTNEDTKTINVAINMDFIPLCFYHFDEPKGYEYELIYLFAKEYNYQINFTRLENDPQRMTYLTEGKANITGGHFTITEGRKETIHFSEPILKTSTVFTVRTDSKKEFLTNIVLDKNYEEKPNNNIEFKAKFSNATKNASCTMPKQFNDTILVNCTIYNITDIDPYTQGFEYGNSSDHVNFVYYSFNASTLLKANELIPNSNVITETNKSKSILSKDNNDTNNNDYNNGNDNGNNNDNNDNDDNDNSNNKNDDSQRYNYFHKNSNRGLSTGGIVAIVVCCVVTLAAFIAIGMATKNAAASSSEDRANLNNSEIRKI